MPRGGCGEELKVLATARGAGGTRLEPCTSLPDGSFYVRDTTHGTLPRPRGANIDPVPSPRSGMCGEEEDDEIAPRPDFPLIKGHTCCRLGAHFDDVVTIVEAFGEKPRIGYFEDFDDKWGAAIIWMDGSRTWYPWDRWDEQKNPGWRFELAPPNLFIKAPDFAVAPKEEGRGKLPRPPVSARPRAKKMTLWQAQAAASAFATGQFCYVAKGQLCEPVQDSPSRPEGLRLTSDTMGDRSPTTGFTSDGAGDRS